MSNRKKAFPSNRSWTRSQTAVNGATLTSMSFPKRKRHRKNQDGDHQMSSCSEKAQLFIEENCNTSERNYETEERRLKESTDRIIETPINLPNSEDDLCLYCPCNKIENFVVGEDSSKETDSNSSARSYFSKRKTPDSEISENIDETSNKKYKVDGTLDVYECEIM